MERVREILTRFITANERVAVGVSGGIDSMCLLSFLLSSGFPKKENILVVNIEHGIRGEESVCDSEFVADFCHKHGVKLLSKTLNIKADALENGRSIETEARLQRKSVFDELLKSGVADKILLAHHADDQAETVLMHIFRGSGLCGLKGMSIFSGGYLRPLLPLTRGEIEDYVRKNGIPYVEDSTNADTEYNRNFIRREVLPLVKKRWMGAENALLRLSEAAKKEDDFISSLLKEEYIYEKTGAVCLNLEALKIDALAPRYIIKALKLAGLDCDFENSHINAVMGLKDSKNGKGVCVVHGIKAVREYDHIAFYKEGFYEEFCLDFSTGVFKLPCGILKIRECEPTPCRGVLRIDADKLPRDTVIRNRHDGDLFKPYGGGTKKLKDYLIDKKIPKRIRDTLPVIAFKERIFAVAGVEIADEVKLCGDAKRALEIEYVTYNED